MQRIYAEALPILETEFYKLSMVTGYAAALSVVKAHLDALQPWHDRASEADQKAIAEHTAATYEVLFRNFGEALKAKLPLDEGFAKIAMSGVGNFGHFNSERERLVTAQEALPNPIALGVRQRAGGCPAAMAPKDGSSTPRLAENFPSSADFYPPLAKASLLAGTAVVRVAVSDTGCAQTVEIAKSSGARMLDEAALNLALAGLYHPAAAGDKAVPGTLRFRIRFEPD